MPNNTATKTSTAAKFNPPVRKHADVDFASAVTRKAGITKQQSKLAVTAVFDLLAMVSYC